MKYRKLKLKYYFDSGLLNSLNLPIKQYSLEYILNKIIYDCNIMSNNMNNNILNAIINNSKINDKLDFHLLKRNISSFIRNNMHERIPNYLDIGYRVASIVI